MMDDVVAFREEASQSHDGGPPVHCAATWAYGMPMNSRDVIAAIRSDGWFEVTHAGSHVQFKHPNKPGRVTVPHPRRDIPAGTLRSIEKQAGIRLR